LTVKEHIKGDFMLMLGDNIFAANISDVVERQRQSGSDAAFLVERVAPEEASRYGVCDVTDDGEIVEVVEKPADPPTNLVMTGFYTFSPAILHACELVQPSNRGEYEITDAINLLIHSGRTIDAIEMNGWRIDIGYPEDRDAAEQRLRNSMSTGTDRGVDRASTTE
jgi:glucose-1-phosphate thymidylyltransferase